MVGTNDLKTGGKFYKIEKYIAHEDHGDFVSTYYNDIAVLRVQESIEFNDKVQPIEYSPEQVAPDSLLTITGWGMDEVCMNVLILTELFQQTLDFNRCGAYQDTCKFFT